MGKYIKGIERGQMILFPTYIDEMIEEDNEVRVIDAFVESLDLGEMGIKRSKPNEKGTNAYDPRDLLKLYIYGYKNRVRSSRRLEKLCKKDIEAKWLMRGLEPDFRTINDFRKSNAKVLKNVFKELVMICEEMGVVGEESSQDGEKIKAQNSKERNYTLNKIDERQKRIEKRLEEYLKRLDEADKEEEKMQQEGKEIKLPKKEEMEKRIERLKEEREKLKKYEKEMEKRGESQISLTDKESKLMKNNGKFDVAYNNQVLVSDNHFVINYEADNNPADTGTMEKVSNEGKKNLKRKIIKDITDKGYNDRKDMMRCLERGIIPEVTPMEGKEEYELEEEYEEAKISEEMKKSEDEEDIKRCLKAGVVPEVYKEYLEVKEIKEKTETVTKEEVEKLEKSDEELREYAMENKCFMKNKQGKVYCPEGETLRAKSKNGEKKKYCNKRACKNCKNPCTISKYKEVVMRDNQIISTKDRKKREEFNGKVKKEKIKVKKVIYKLKPKEEDLKKRMGLSEHVHGTMKKTDEFYYFLLKGKEKVNGELAIYYSGSNIRRLMNIKPVKEIIEFIKNRKNKLQGYCAQKQEINQKEIRKEEKGVV